MRLKEITKDKTLHPPSISVGDEVKVGKWKNRKAEVKGFTKDDHGQPVLKTTKGDQKLFKPRVTKLEPKEKLEEITSKEEFKAKLADPNYQDVLDRFESLKRRTADYSNSIELSYSYNAFVSDFTITAILPHNKYPILASVIIDVFDEYRVWSDAATDIQTKEDIDIVDYHVYTDSKGTQ